MQRRARTWTRLAACLMLTLPVTGCVSAGKGKAICDGSAAARSEHAAALVKDGGPLSLVSGAHLIRLIDAGCGDDA